MSEESPFEATMKTVTSVIVFGVLLGVWTSPHELHKFISDLVPMAVAAGILFAPFSFIRAVFGVTGWLYVGIIATLALHSILLLLHTGLERGASSPSEFSLALYNGMTWALCGEFLLSLVGCAVTGYFVDFLMKRFERNV